MWGSVLGVLYFRKPPYGGLSEADIVHLEDKYVLAKSRASTATG